MADLVGVLLGDTEATGMEAAGDPLAPEPPALSSPAGILKTR